MEYTLGRWIDLAFLICISILISIVDIREKKIPDILLLIGFTGFIITKIFLNKEVSGLLILDTAVGFFSIFCLWFLTKGGIGLGDAKLAALIGFILGMFFWWIALFIASLTGLFVGAFLILGKKIEKKDPIPFAPFLAIGGIVSYILKYFIMKDTVWIW